MSFFLENLKLKQSFEFNFFKNIYVKSILIVNLSSRQLSLIVIFILIFIDYFLKGQNRIFS